MIGLNRSAIGTVVERTSRYTLLVHLPRLEGYGTVPPVKNGPALGGFGATAMKGALQSTMTAMPEELLRSLTWDRDPGGTSDSPYRPRNPGASGMTLDSAYRPTRLPVYVRR